MVTETDRNKARSAVVSAYHALDCVTIPFSFLHAFADAAVDAVSTDAEPVAMDDEERTPMPAGFDDALWRKADEVHHAMALVARDQECVKIIYAALSTHKAEPVKTAPSVAVNDDMINAAMQTVLNSVNVPVWECMDASDVKQIVEAALSAQVQDVAGGVADQIIGQIEERFPNWRSYRDLIDCIDCTLHDLRQRAEGR